MLRICAALWLSYCSFGFAAAVESKQVFELLKSGRALPAARVLELEGALTKNPEIAEARIELLAYYTARPAGMDLDAIKAARLRHILWIIKNEPKTGLGLFAPATSVYRINCMGDELADAAGYRQAQDLWLDEVFQHPNDEVVRQHAFKAIQYCNPEKAEALLQAAGTKYAFGDLYATAVLGVTGVDYWSVDASSSDGGLRQQPFAAKAMKILKTSEDRELITGAATTLLRQGAILWADGKLDWDYTPLGNALLDKLQPISEASWILSTLPTSLPKRGERPPMTIRVGGNVQAASIVHKVTPRYPSEAKSKKIEGTVQMLALIGLDGKVLNLKYQSGPAELVAASMSAVKLWEYQPTLLNGKPVFVLTQIDLNYTLSH